MRVILELQTPLWTGDASKASQRVVGTGLMGGLRWWYEALVRGLGGWACDPTDADARCPPSGTAVAPETVPRLLCPACQLFGATGWAKTFTLALDDRTQEEYPPAGRGRVQATGGRLNRRGKPSAWYFDPGRSGRLSLFLRPRRPADTETVLLLLGLLEFIRRNAALGAKTGLGYGLFEWGAPPPDLPVADEWAKMVASKAHSGRSGPNGRWPDLREMFFAEVTLRTEWKPTDFVNFKYDLRAAFRGGGAAADLCHFLLGTTRTDPNQATKIKMALLPNRCTLRLWGWVPADLPGGFPRDRVMATLHAQIGKQGSVSRWRAFNSPRDTVQRCADGTAYLRSLMEE